MNEKLDDIEKRVKKLEDMHKWGIIALVTIGAWYWVFKVVK